MAFLVIVEAVELSIPHTGQSMHKRCENLGFPFFLCYSPGIDNLVKVILPLSDAS